MTSSGAGPSVPEFFCTTMRKVEPIGGGCVRVYCSVECGDAWEDRFTILIPIAAALVSAQFVIKSANEIHTETQSAMISIEGQAN